MADFNKIVTLRNAASAAVTPTNGAATFEVVYDRSDENIVLRFTSTDATAALITVVADGTGGGGTDMTFQLTQNEIKYVGALESMRFKRASTGRVHFKITNVNGSAYSGTLTNIKVEVIGLPKTLTN